MNNETIQLDKFEIIMSKVFIGVFVVIAVVNLFR